MKLISVLRTAVPAALLLASAAFAQTETTTEGTAGTLPPAQSSHDPHPQVATPPVPKGGVVSQAGVGGDVAYGRAGVVELGGSAGLTHSDGFTQVIIGPTVGWFFQDNLELSGILNLNYAHTAGGDATLVTLLAEPSYHLPLSQTTFAFIGLGFGLGYINAGNGGSAGFDLAPRLGFNLMVGRSGILSPNVFLNYTTAGSESVGGATAVTVRTSYGFQVGYTVML